MENDFLSKMLHSAKSSKKMDEYDKDIFKCLQKLLSCESLLRKHNESIFQQNEGPHQKRARRHPGKRESNTGEM